jgi:hypothetical protein
MRPRLLRAHRAIQVMAPWTGGDVRVIQDQVP